MPHLPPDSTSRNNQEADWLLRTRLKMRQLLLLVALDDVRNINGAAALLNMSQPAASKLLKDLEEVLGVSLFERLPRGVRPTSYGETMIRHTRMALTSLAQAQEDIASLKSGLSGQVNVGVIMGPGMLLMPPAIARMEKQSPLLRIGIELDNSNVLMKRLKQGELDFLVARIPDHEDKADLVYEELSDEQICAVVREGHPLLSRKHLSLRELATLSWVSSPPGTILRHRFDMMFRREGLEPPSTVVDTTAVMVVIGLLQQTDFLYLVPSDVARGYMDFGKLCVLPIDLPCKMDGFGIITRRNQLLSPAAKILLQTVRDVAADIYSECRIKPDSGK
jgi:DNA-binding transcriptional LysR family regulator